MKSIVENLSTTRVRIAVEVPFDELKEQFDAAYKQIGAQVRVPGFRPGKVPPRVLEARVGRGAVIQEVVNAALPEAYGEAVESNGINPLGQPEIEVTDMSDDGFKFTAEVDKRPDFELPELDGIEVSVEEDEVSDEQVDEQIESLRARFSTLKGVDRAVQSGDFVSIDLAATIDGEELEGGTASGLSYEVGSGELVPGLDEQLEGMNVDEEKTFSSELVGGEHQGQAADVTVTVKSVKERELPEVDDDFASLASEFDTIDELKDDLRTRFERVNRMSLIGKARDAAIEAVVDKVTFDVPEGALKNEIEARAHDAVHSFDHDEDRLNEWIESEGKTREEFDKELEENAVRSVRAQLVLDAIVDAEEIGVEDAEVTSYIIQQAGRFGMAPQQFADEIGKAGQVGALIADVRRNKAVELVLSKVTIKDGRGEQLDLDAIRTEAMEMMAQAQAGAMPTPVAEADDASADSGDSADSAGSADSADSADSAPSAASGEEK